MPADEPPPQALHVPGLTKKDGQAQKLVRPPPPMRVVTKGWWTLREETKPVDELERADREQ